MKLKTQEKEVYNLFHGSVEQGMTSQVIDASVPDPKPVLTLCSLLVCDDHLPKTLNRQSLLALHNVKKAIAIAKAYLKNGEYPSGTGLDELLLYVHQKMCKLKNSIDDVDDENGEKGAQSPCELKVLIFGNISNKKTVSCAAIKRKKEEEKKKEREIEV
eukprot:15282339-Ditylum_brightwellii.AAC.1